MKLKRIFFVLINKMEKVLSHSVETSKWNVSSTFIFRRDIIERPCKIYLYQNFVVFEYLDCIYMFLEPEIVNEMDTLFIDEEVPFLDTIYDIKSKLLVQLYEHDFIILHNSLINYNKNIDTFFRYLISKED